MWTLKKLIEHSNNNQAEIMNSRDAEIKKLKERNNKLKKWHAKALRHSAHLGDQVEKVYSNLRIVSKSLIAKDYIAAEELLSEILEGE